MKRFRLVIFDCDGVLFESRRANAAYYNHIRGHVGLPPLQPDELEFVHMSTADEALKHIIPDQDLRAAAEAFRLNLDYRPFARLMSMEPHLLNLLNFLKPNYKTAVSTNRSYTIGPLLQDFGLTPFFDLVVSCLDVTRPKPDPEPLLLILEQLKTTPAQALYVGDSPVDEAAARAAGVALAAYRNPQLEADYHLEDLRGVKTILLEG